MRDKPILSLQQMLHKDYDLKRSAEKNLVMFDKGLGAKTY
jgi:hypothetical protein